MEQKTNINPAILQPMLESSPNAAEKGQSQFFTPLAFARELATVLPGHRPAVVDLNCGAGALLQASALKNTEVLLGADIDPCRGLKVEGCDQPRIVSRITHDLTRLYPLLKEVSFTADLFVLNPPWRLWWYRDRLKDLANSDLPAVREAFAQMEEGAFRKGTVDGTIDSTVATLMIALDLCTLCGEGMLIANNNTLDRLIFNPGAPHGALARHIWARVVVPGNPMTGIDDCLWEKPAAGEAPAFATGVIYFAADHDAGPTHYHWPDGRGGPLPDRALRLGSELRSRYGGREDLLTDWNAVKEQVAELNGKTPASPYQLWLTASGRIRTNLSSFAERSVKTNKKEAERLFKLEGRTPMDLVIQRAQRDELLHVVERGGWAVEPALVAAVQAAVANYHAARAPLYPLDPIKRLGYLDEVDVIECRVDLMGAPALTEEQVKLEEKRAAEGKVPLTRRHALLFAAGQKYSLRTQTVNVTRSSGKWNPFLSRMEDVEHSGQELAIYISNGIVDPTEKESKLVEYVFMDAKIKGDENTAVQVGKKQKYGSPDNVTIDFTLQQLADHFVVPEVPDVATANPGGYRDYLAALAELERVTDALCTV